MSSSLQNSLGFTSTSFSESIEHSPDGFFPLCLVVGVVPGIMIAVIFEGLTGIKGLNCLIAFVPGFLLWAGMVVSEAIRISVHNPFFNEAIKEIEGFLLYGDREEEVLARQIEALKKSKVHPIDGSDTSPEADQDPKAASG